MSIGFFIPAFPKLSETFILREYLELQRQGVALVPAAYQPAIEDAAQPEAQAAAADFCYLRQQRGDEVLLLAEHWRARGVTHAHIHFGNAGADVPLAAAATLGISASLSLHAQDIYLSPDIDLRRRLQQCAFSVTCTAFNRAELLRRTGVAEEKVRLLYHGVDLPEPAQRTPGMPVVAVGRLVASKGFDLLVRALVELPDLRGVIIGEGPEGAVLRQLAAACGVSDRMTFAGAQPFTRVRDEFAGALAAVVPSRVLADGDSDGIPNVLLEALAHGVPVVASGIRSIREAIRDGENGLLVPENDAAALAAALRRLAEEDGLAARLADGGRETVRRQFSLTGNVAQLRGMLTAAR